MNEIGNVIVSTEEGKAKYDEALKELLANKQFLARIMKGFVSEFVNAPLEDIEKIYIEAESVSVSKIPVERNLTNIEGVSNEDATLNEGRIYYDIIFRACYPHKSGAYIGMYINVEAQNAYYKGYPVEVRGMYYAARRFSSQLKSINNETDYRCLQKVYSIWVCMGDVPDREANTVTLYRTEKNDIIGTVKRERENYDFINVIILRINDKAKCDDEVLGMLQVLCSNLINKNEKLKLLKQYGICLDECLKEGVSHMCNLSELIETRGEARGEALGKTEKAREMAAEMLKDGIPYETVARYAKVSVDTLKEWTKTSV